MEDSEGRAGYGPKAALRAVSALAALLLQCETEPPPPLHATELSRLSRFTFSVCSTHGFNSVSNAVMSATTEWKAALLLVRAKEYADARSRDGYQSWCVSGTRGRCPKLFIGDEGHATW